MSIAFDPDKDLANQTKHKVSLSFGDQVLADTNRLDTLDVRFDYDEDRFISYGMVNEEIWVCVYTPRDDTDRIISVRKANGREKYRYENTPR